MEKEIENTSQIRPYVMKNFVVNIYEACFTFRIKEEKKKSSRAEEKVHWIGLSKAWELFTKYL